MWFLKFLISFKGFIIYVCLYSVFDWFFLFFCVSGWGIFGNFIYGIRIFYVSLGSFWDKVIDNILELII